MGYNQSNNPFSRKSSSPINHGDGSGLSPQDVEMNAARAAFSEQMPPQGDYTQEQYDMHDAQLNAIRAKYAPSRRSSSPLNQVEEQVYSHELSHDEILEDTRSGENYLEQESYEKPGYDEYGGKIRGKKGRKTRKLERIKQDMNDIGHRIMFEKTPDTISQKADRKFDKYLKTKKQLKNL
jgi:hypothetical protein